jgi:acyl-CoA synthetase (AMP-forming)/AMP-acid ligase II
VSEQPLEHLSAFAATAPDRPAVVVADTGETRTYGELEARSNQVAHLLRSLGVETGDTLALVLDNCAEYFEAAWGGLRAGLYVTPINWHLSADEIEYVVRDCGARAVFVSPTCAASVPDIGVPRFVLGGGVDGFASYEEALAEQPTTPIDDQGEGQWMFYSSGTTGRPKGIKPPGVGGPLGAPTVFTARVRGMYGGRESTVYLSPAPRYPPAPSGWASAVHRLGGTAVTTKRFDPVQFLETIDRYAVTLAQVVPTHMVRLLKLPEEERARFDLSSLEILVHAAAPCPPEVKRAMIEWLGPRVYEYYSASEGVGFCAIGPEEALTHPGSVGR